MAESVAARVNVDRALAVACVLGAVASASLLIWDRPGFFPKDRAGRVLATLQFAEGGVRHRPADTLVWDSAVAGLPLLARDAVFVSPRAQARVVFASGGVMEISQNALVVIEEQSDGVVAELKQGVIAAVGGGGGLDIKSKAGAVKLRAGDVAQVEGVDDELEVDVVMGAPALEGRVERRFGNVALTSPSPNRRFFAKGGKVAPFAFEVGGEVQAVAAIQVASDRQFASSAGMVSPGTLYTPLGPGTYYWRAVDRNGRPLSSALQFSVFEDQAPALLAPRAGDLVIGAAGPAALLWSQHPRATHYEVELSSDPKFEQDVLRSKAQGVALTLPSKLTEGTVYWRVRARDELRLDSPWSSPSTFVYSAKHLPKPPRLRDSRLEVEHAPAPP